jgi:hypothetical protein
MKEKKITPPFDEPAFEPFRFFSDTLEVEFIENNLSPAFAICLTPLKHPFWR